ncbi:MAG: hypothetical protein ACTHJW_20235 [Streptosporangiaceae bacterium]
MDEISFGPKREFRLPSGRWLVVAAAVLVIAFATVIITSGGSARRPPRAPRPSIAASAPSPSPTAAAGTFLRTCADANWGQLESKWQAGSFKAGPLWFVADRREGYVHDGSFRQLARRPYNGTKGDAMIIEVANGSTVTMKPTPKARSYFRFVDGFNGPNPNDLPAGETGFTLSACPRGKAGPNGQVTDFYLGYMFKATRPAMVDIRTRAATRPIRVIFTYPGG